MLDRAAIAWLRPPLQAMATRLQRWGIGADAVTLAGFVIGMAGALAIAGQQPLAGLVLLAISRLCDGLDGAVARLGTPTDRGAFLDITLDFLFYASVPLAFAVADPRSNALAAASVPLAFAVADPRSNALAAAVLLAAFIGTGSSFLAFALLAERRGLHSTDYPDKGLYYLGGLTEASETLICFALMCLWPQHFALWAYGFAALCGLTIVTRLWAGWRV